MKINLISDTNSVPTKRMLEAMMGAKVGNDAFKTDPDTNRLEEKVASMFKMDTAMFFPSGTMANQTAIKLHTQPGDQVICDKFAHVYNYEGGGMSFNSGVSCKLIDGVRGMFTAEQVQKAVNPPEFYHSPLTTLVCLENTTNKGGGACWDFNEIQKIREVCNKNNLGLHLDGARLWNALVEKNESPVQYGEIFDTISVCLSKGLGCPVGSLLVGKKEMIDKAFRIKKMLGGLMCQSGYLAAAGIYALDHHIERLAKDHQKAKELGNVLKNLSYIKKVEPIETNIIIFNLDENIDEMVFIEKLREKNIEIISMGDSKLRIVTHLGYTGEMHDRFLTILKDLKV